MKNYYQVLGIEPNATAQEIKSAYKEYVKKFHPDKNGGDKFFEERFKEVQEAYEILSDFSRRQEYDFTINQAFSGGFSEYDFDEFKNEFENHKRKTEEELRREFEQKLKAERERVKREADEYKNRAEEELKREFEARLKFEQDKAKKESFEAKKKFADEKLTLISNEFNWLSKKLQFDISFEKLFVLNIGILFIVGCFLPGLTIGGIAYLS